MTAPGAEFAYAMNDPYLTDRQAQVLSQVIHEHIATAQPVASAALARRPTLAVSPATVRNEFAVLEEAGLLAQPHTSAGRVPTVRGYRYFVAHLMTRSGLSEQVQRTIRHQFYQAGHHTDRWLRLSAAVVAHTSGAAGLVTSRPADRAPRLYHAGLTEILDEPELADGQCLRVVVEVLEYGTGLQPVIDGLPSQGVEVIIGDEPPTGGVPHVTLVLSRFGGDDPQGGVLGVIGPTRMPYERAVPVVEFVADLMTQLLAIEAD